ncbi:TATA box-binding protein-like 1 [Macrosteles quadrilineatus]|uniref:TATA box-binding protein-like 1 n=1 Tax=Macrosteles quadrilineatus TaxID=74068 RepID=UPI0023E25C28|nr:TATA box-binding protein-like 1 [Macrosteles quadrilineatus]XP_054282495.1 TATA box-binding protein-like 1 [Macrosteles quadrilineatus]
MMATAIQKNGMKSLPNGAVNHLVMEHQYLIKESQVQPQTKTEDQQMQNEALQTHNESEVNCEEQEPEPEIDIVINNVVCSFSVRCHLNLRQIALSGVNVEYRREHGMVTMKLRKPYTTASIWSSGKITCTGATSEDQSHVAARRFARRLQKLGFNTRFANFRIVNVLGTCSMPFAIKINAFSEYHKPQAEYEPELHPGVTFKLKQPKATLKIFSTGSITVTAPSVSDVQQAIEYIYPLVYQFRKERTKEDELLLQQKRMQGLKRKAAAVAESEDDTEGNDDSDCE